MKQQIILIVLLSFVCFVAAASDEYCPFNPSGECPGVRADTAQKSGDSFFYCDTGASMFGSDTCRYLGLIDGRYPVSTGACPSGYPIIFFSTGEVSDLSVDVHYVNCLDYGCTEVTEPRRLPNFNGLYAVDTAVVTIHDVDTLVVTGVTNQLSASELNNIQSSYSYDISSTQYPQYYVALAFSTDELCSNFTFNDVTQSFAPVLNPRISPKLVEIVPTSSPSFPFGLSYVSAYPTFNTQNDAVDNGATRATNVPKGLYRRAASKDEKQTRFSSFSKATTTTSEDANVEPELADQPQSERPNSVLGLTRHGKATGYYLVMISCYGLCDFWDPVFLFVPNSRYLSQFSSDLPWTNNYPALNQLADASTSFSTSENYYRTLPDSPFSYNSFLPRPLVFHNKKGDFYFGLQGVQRMPLADIRGLDECGNIEDPYSADFREAYNFDNSETTRFARQAARFSQSLFGGTTNLRFFRCPSETEEEQESPGICDNLFFEEEAPITAPIPHPTSSLQYSGRSTVHGYQLRDANEETEDETPTENIYETRSENEAGFTPPGPAFWTEAASATSNEAICREQYTGGGGLGKRVNRDVDVADAADGGHKSSPDSQRYLGGTRPTQLLGGSRATRSSPRSLTAGLAGNGLPAVLGISTVATGEPSAAGWSLVLTVCLTESCDQQVFRYLMDSSALHDNWGIMDDPFAAVNKILNHPDGSWSIVLFVQPQGEQIDRHTDLPRGEGSTGKPLIINCLDDTCSSAYVSLLAPNRLQSSIPNELSFITLPFTPTITNDVHSFTYVGESSEYLLVTVRDLPQAPAVYGPTTAADLPNYAPSSVRLWKTNRYASPTGYPCTAESVGTMETIDGSLFICTRLNTGHDLTLGDISGWVRYYEWVDVGHSFASRLWANLPAGRSPLNYGNFGGFLTGVPLTSGLQSKAVSTRATTSSSPSSSAPSVETALIAGQPLACCDQQVWVPAPGQHTDIALASTLYQPTIIKVYFSSLDVPSMLPLAGFYVSLLDNNGESNPVLKGFPTLIHGAELYCQVLVIPVPAPLKITSASAIRVGLSFLHTTADACESDAQPCQIAIAGVEVLGSTPASSTTPYFAPFPADLSPSGAKPGSWACPAQ